MDSEIDELSKSVGKVFAAWTFIGEAMFCLAFAALAACAIYFAYGWVEAHPKRTAIIVGSCAFWITANWRK